MRYIFFLLSLFLLQAAQAQSGFLDESFADKGIKRIYTGGGCYATAIQQDGKILLAGDGETGQTIIRLLPDGSVDSSFGENGFVILDYNQYGYRVMNGIKVQGDGKIITLSGFTGSIMLARFREDGSVDSSFGDKGVVVHTFTYRTYLNSMQLQLDGKIVGGGSIIDEHAPHDAVVIRFEPDGNLDKSFGNEGETVIRGGDSFNGNSVVLQPDGKIVIGGEAFDGDYKFFLARLNADGTMDVSFGEGGAVKTNIGEGDEHINSLALQQDGKIVAAGLGQILVHGLLETMTVARYNSDGSLDKKFGENGAVTMPFGKYASEATTVLLQRDEKIVVTGRVTNESQSYSDPAICRLKTDGSLDSSFAINGEQITETDGSNGEYAAALQQDSKIILTGNSFIDNQSYYNAIRYLNDAILPLHFSYFNAAPTSNGVALNWQTAQENNNNYFSVERSGDSRFSGNTEIARIHSNWQQGTGNHQQTYSYTDNTPLQGTNFYRLKQVDKDGKFSYSQIVRATVQNGLSVVLYPNPVRDVLNIKALDAGMSYELSVMNEKGSVVAKASINNTSSYKWNLRSLSKGVYYLQAESKKLNAESRKTTVKFVKE